MDGFEFVVYGSMYTVIVFGLGLMFGTAKKEVKQNAEE